MAERYLFTTEGHVIPITSSLRSPDWDEEEDSQSTQKNHVRRLPLLSKSDVVVLPKNSTHSVVS